MAEQYGVLNSYLNSFVSKILENDDLCKLLYYNTNDDIISKPNLNAEQKLELIGSNILINKRVPLIQKEAKPLLMLRIVEVQYANKKTTTIEDVRIMCYIVCANSVVETENGTRDLCIVTALDKTFEDSQSGDIGIGKIRKLRTSDLADLGTEYQGYAVNYLISDFNTSYVRDKWS